MGRFFLFSKRMHVFTGCVIALLLASCSSTEKYPEAYGVFVWDGKVWVELRKASSDAGVQKMHYGLPNDTMFLLHSKSVGALAEQFSVHRYYKLRSRSFESTLPDGTKRQNPVLVRDASFKERIAFLPTSNPIPGKAMPVKGQPEMIIWKPTDPLPLGQYQPVTTNELVMKSFYGTEPPYPRFNVGNFLFDSLEGRNACVDIVRVSNAFIVDSPARDRYVPCKFDSVDGNSQPKTSMPLANTPNAAPTPSVPQPTNSPQPNVTTISASSVAVELNPRWYGTWIDKKGGDKLTAGSVKFGDCTWAAKEAEIPKRAGCWAHYGKSQTLSELVGTGRATINTQSATIAQTVNSTERYKVVKFTRRDERGEDLVGDCEVVYFYDRERVLNRTWCQGNSDQRVELTVLEKSSN